MKIRKAKKDDLKRIDEIYRRGVIEEVKLQFPKKSNKKIEDELKKWERDRAKDFEHSIKSPKTYLVVLGNKQEIYGFGEAQIMSYDKTKAEITKIYVEKEYQRKGFASKIMKELLKWLKNKKVKSVSSGIFIKNKPSINLNKKFGFEITAIRMQKKLK